jgi:hypothetical protein
MFAMSQQTVSLLPLKTPLRVLKTIIFVLHRVKNDTDGLWIKMEGVKMVWAGKASWDLVNIWSENQNKFSTSWRFFVFFVDIMVDGTW